MTKDHFESCMKYPSCSGHEEMFAEFIMDWGKSHGCSVKKDGHGNVFLKKGSASGYYPCLANHMDTVFHDQEEMVKEKVFKELIWNGDTVTAKNPLTGKQTGIGGDDMGGCCIAMAVIERLPACKAIFVVNEEQGMIGSKAADKSFFDDCAFIISNDSPDRNRATHYSSGVELYSKEFFDKYLEPICKKHGVTDFRSEPFTDIIQYRRYELPSGKHLECLNFGNGFRNAHQSTEYAKFSDVNAAEELLYALCTEIPTDVQHTSDIKEEPRPSYTWSGYSYPYSGRSSWGSRWGTWSSSRNSYDKFEQKGHFDWVFGTAEARDKYADRMGPKFGETLKLEKTGKQSVRVSGEYLYLRVAYMFAHNYKNSTSYTQWSEFERSEKLAALQFDSDFKPDRAESKAPRGPNDRAAVFLPAADAEDIDVMEAAMLDTAVEIDREDDGLTVSGRLKDVQEAYVLAYNAVDGESWKSFDELDAPTKKDFWDSVTFDGDEEDDAIEADYEVVGGKEDGVEQLGDLFSWSKSRAEKAKAPDAFNGHSPDERCSMKLKLPGDEKLARETKSKVMASGKLTVAEIQDGIEVSGALSDVMKASVDYLNAWTNGRLSKFEDMSPGQQESFWKEVKFLG